MEPDLYEKIVINGLQCEQNVIIKILSDFKLFRFQFKKYRMVGISPCLQEPNNFWKVTLM